MERPERKTGGPLANGKVIMVFFCFANDKVNGDLFGARQWWWWSFLRMAKVMVGTHGATSVICFQSFV